jgi:hypothetical protein
MMAELVQTSGHRQQDASVKSISAARCILPAATAAEQEGCPQGGITSPNCAGS